MLDGWFIKQAKDRDREKIKNEFESKTNSKIANSQEVFYMAHSAEHLEAIESLNNPEASMAKKHRSSILSSSNGTVKDSDFETLNLQ